VTEAIEELLGGPWLVQRWESLNQDLFAALRLQEMLLFMVLGLIVVVSTFNTSSTLVILVRERLPDIGVLASLGLSPRGLFWLFACYGMGLGIAGILLGVSAGAGIAWVFDHYELIRFDPDVAKIYFIDSIPFRLEAGDLLAIVSFSLVVTLAACSLPARRAARLLPAEVLRAE
jgi:lipoprotein-releasing system permease protein